jgi:RNA polymerase sigma-70 factor (ECF subfamily)
VPALFTALVARHWRGIIRTVIQIVSGPSHLDLTLPVALGSALPAPAAETLVIALFDAQARRLLRYIEHCGLDRDAAEDVLQETFLALHRHLVLDRPQSNLTGWLFQVAHNLARREQRRRRRAGPATSWDVASVSRVAAAAPTPEQAFHAAEADRRLRAAVETLPERDRSCLRLRADGLRYREIAAALNMSLGGVAKSIARSLKRVAHLSGEQQ